MLVSVPPFCGQLLRLRRLREQRQRGCACIIPG